ncbi:hypothetical protein [Roseospirillum parvum]|uniref:hypothetical protein n=1 Tax=Roseospirillum parvum TaxID=83401 RepID=UPI0011603511|nr:hypothetical protein [Roseospirillum parvum]
MRIEDIVFRIIRYIGYLALSMLALIVVVAFSIWLYYNPFKIKDPEHPDFKPQNFKFRDYSNRDELDQALIHSFPIGLPKTEAEKVIFSNLGVTKSKISEDVRENSFSYYYEDPISGYFWSHNFSIQYDNSDRIVQIFRNGTPLY